MIDHNKDTSWQKNGEIKKGDGPFDYTSNMESVHTALLF